MFQKKQQHIGYVGVHKTGKQLHLVQLEKDEDKQKVKLITYVQAEIPEQASIHRIAQTIQEIRSVTALSTNQAIVSIDDTSTIAVTFRIPYNIPEEKLKETVKLKARDRYGEKLEKMSIGWTVTEHVIERNADGTADPEKSAWEVLFVATPQHEVRTTEKCAIASGLELVAPEITALSMARACSLKYKEGFQTILHADTQDNIALIAVRNGALLTKKIITLKQIEEEIKEGESAIVSGMLAYAMEKYLKERGRNAEMINPWKGMLVPEGLEERLRILAPALAVPCGLALREILRSDKA